MDILPASEAELGYCYKWQLVINKPEEILVNARCGDEHEG